MLDQMQEQPQDKIRPTLEEDRSLARFGDIRNEKGDIEHVGLHQAYAIIDERLRSGFYDGPKVEVVRTEDKPKLEPPKPEPKPELPKPPEPIKPEPEPSPGIEPKEEPKEAEKHDVHEGPEGDVHAEPQPSEPFKRGNIVCSRKRSRKSRSRKSSK